MKSATVLVSCDIGQTKNVRKTLDEIPQVKKVNIVKGAYDMVLRVKASTFNELKDTITWKVRKIPQVRSTLTLKEKED